MTGDELDRLAGEQGVRPVDNVADLQSPEPLTAGEFDAWSAALRQCRTPESRRPAMTSAKSGVVKMDRHTREQQTDALLSTLHVTGKVDGVVVATIRSELTILRRAAEAADIYRQGADAAEAGRNLDFALDIWKGYRSALGDPICRACGRTFTPSHDASAGGPTSRHPFIPA